MNHNVKNVTSKNKSWNYTILKSYLILLLCVSIVPQINYFSRIFFFGYKTEIIYGLMLGLILINIKMIKYETKMVLISFFWMLYIIVIAFIARDSYYQLYFLTAIVVLLYSYFHVILFRKKNFNIINKISKYFLIISIVVAIFAIRALSIDPFISRYLAGGSIDTFNYYSKIGAIGYDYIYGFVIISPVMFGYCFNKEIAHSSRMLIIFSFILNSLLLFMANFSMAILLYFTGVLFLLLFKKKNRIYKFFLMFITIVFSLLVDFRAILRYLLNTLLPLFKSIIPSYTFNKLMSLNNLLNNNELSGSIDIRYNKLINNFDIFVNNPIFGNALSGQVLNVGEHAEFIDIIASGGLVGSIFYFSFIFLMLIKVYKQYESHEIKPYISSSLLLIILIGCTNNLFRAANLSLLIFIILPSLSLINMKKKI